MLVGPPIVRIRPQPAPLYWETHSANPPPPPGRGGECIYMANALRGQLKLILHINLCRVCVSISGLIWTLLPSLRGHRYKSALILLAAPIACGRPGKRGGLAHGTWTAHPAPRVRTEDAYKIPAAPTPHCAPHTGWGHSWRGSSTARGICGRPWGVPAGYFVRQCEGGFACNLLNEHLLGCMVWFLNTGHHFGRHGIVVFAQTVLHFDTQCCGSLTRWVQSTE